jgi:hypothetical protein
MLGVDTTIQQVCHAFRRGAVCITRICKTLLFNAGPQRPLAVGGFSLWIHQFHSPHGFVEKDGSLNLKIT